MYIYKEWYECVERVVNGTMNMMKKHMEMHRLGWMPQTAHAQARELYQRMYHMKFLPPGRGLWAMVFFFFTALLRCFPLSFSVLLFPIPLVDYLFSFLFSLGSFSPPLDPHQIKR